MKIGDIVYIDEYPSNIKTTGEVVYHIVGANVTTLGIKYKKFKFLTKTLHLEQKRNAKYWPKDWPAHYWINEYNNNIYCVSNVSSHVNINELVML